MLQHAVPFTPLRCSLSAYLISSTDVPLSSPRALNNSTPYLSFRYLAHDFTHFLRFFVPSTHRPIPRPRTLRPNPSNSVMTTATNSSSNHHTSSPSLIRVTHRQLSQLQTPSRRSQVSISWPTSPLLVLVAASPHSKRAMNALPLLLKFLQSLDRVVVAVHQAITSHVSSSIPIVHPPLSPTASPSIPLSNSMDDLRLTDSVSNGSSRKSYHPENVDLVLCLGGDGLILNVLSIYFPSLVPPIVPFNMGSMGFLTPFDFSSHPSDITDILDGKNSTVTMRMRLKCVIEREPVPLRNGTTSPSIHNFENNKLIDEAFECNPREEFHVLNELVIDRGPAPYLSNLEVFCDDCDVTRVQADGIIVATPTGSTAYSLSSGGSMVHPNVPAILFTPICPHSLSFRPVLFPDHVTLQIKVPNDSRATAWVSFDGRHRMELMKGDKVIVSASPWPVPTFSKKDTTKDWFASVSQCLRWNERVLQGAADADVQ